MDCLNFDVRKVTGDKVMRGLYNRFGTIPQNTNCKCEIVNDGSMMHRVKESERITEMKTELQEIAHSEEDKEPQFAFGHAFAENLKSDFSKEEMNTLVSGQSNWKLDGVWEHSERENYSIYLFRRSETEVQWFVVKRRNTMQQKLMFYHIPVQEEKGQIILEFHSDAQSVLMLRTEIDEEIATLRNQHQQEIDQISEDHQDALNEIIIISCAATGGLMLALFLVFMMGFWCIKRRKVTNRNEVIEVFVDNAVNRGSCLK